MFSQFVPIYGIIYNYVYEMTRYCLNHAYWLVCSMSWLLDWRLVFQQGTITWLVWMC